MFCSIKMRASRSIAGQDYHISGAERLLESKDIPACACGLLLRALQHSKGEPSAINLKVEEVDPSCVKLIAPLKVSTLKAKSVEEARELALSYLVRLGIKEKGLFSLLSQCFGLRGAMLVDFKTMERLDLLLGRDEARGIRVTYMDWQGGGGEWQKKNNFAEALVLASKVAAAPGLVAELCVSDDPDYLTGYVASKEFGYVRIAPLKKMGEDFGGRIFFLDQSQASLEECVHFLEKEIVLVKRPETETKDPKLWLGARLDNLRKAKLFRQCNLVTSAQNRSITTCQKSSLNFASNDYLALANHPLVKAKAQEALGRYGAGSGGSRLTCGTLPVHVELEQALARHFGSEDALVFATGYQTNVGTLQALCGRGDVVISDALNHASIIDGCRLSGAEVVVYAHNDMADFEHCCKAYAHRRGLCVSDSVFSMDGDLLNLPEFLEISRRYGFLSMIDEAHALGVLGSQGSAAYFGLSQGADVTIGTLSKALGSEGGFVLGSTDLISLLRNCARSFIFSTSPSPAAMAAAKAALEIMSEEPWRINDLQENIKYFSSFFCKDNKSAIFPIMLGDEAVALQAAAHLRAEGFYLLAIRYPSVAKGQARLRVTLRCDHTKDDLKNAALKIKDTIDTFLVHD